ncbi:MAG: FAD-dependent oxidoreductase [Bacteroidota bacterium]|jgi:NADPH-dependent 2,4-dienoyl-CoA reductase/sulfur reductase-like enzyme
MRQRILVIGGLAAGPAAASKAKRTNRSAEVILFEQSENISSGICEVPYYIGNVITDVEKLSTLTPLDFERTRGVKVHTLHRVEEIQPVKKHIIVRDLYHDKILKYEYDKLILAIGSKTKTIGIAGENARNVFHVKLLSEGLAIKHFINEEKPKRAVIIGGGYVAIEMCEAFRALGLETTLLHRDELPMSKLEMDARKDVLAELTKNSIQFHSKQTLKAFKTDDTGKIVEVVTNSGNYPTDLLILAIGVEPNVELAKSIRAHIGTSGGILTDQHQTTSVDSIYAAGDCCEVKNLVNNRWMYAPLATSAARQGWVAGENSAGGNAIFKGAIRAIAVKAFGMEIASVGVSSREAEESGFHPIVEHILGDSRIAFYPGSEEVHIIAIADKKSKRLIGANVVGGSGSALRANILGVAIQQKMTVEEISKLDLLYSSPFSPLWDPILIAAHQLSKKMDSIK